MEAVDRDYAERLYAEALSLPPEERAAFLAGLEPPALRDDLASLLAHADGAEELLQLLQDDLQLLSGTVLSDTRPSDPLPSADELCGQDLGPYRIEAVVGTGGMGVVYRAVDTRLQRTVALKLLQAPRRELPGVTDRFLREAVAASSLDHPHVCTIYAIEDVPHPDGGACQVLAMAFYDGETLAERIRRGPVPTAQALQWARDVAEALAATHEAGIVHRDLKPANVIVTPEGQVKVLDFGLASLAEASQQLTRPGTRLGTVAYMSPEQTLGAAVDARTDLWALGVMLHELLTGEHPFRRERPEATIHAIRHDAPRPLEADVSADVRQLVEHLLDKAPEDRPATMRQVAEALAGLAAPPSHPRRWALAGASGILAVVLTLLLTTVIGPWWVQQRFETARALLPAIEQHVDEGDFGAAYRLAAEAEDVLGEDPALARLWPQVADSLFVDTVPDGAQVTVQRFGQDGEPTAPRVLGRTPIEGARVPRGAYRVVMYKEGFATAERVATRALFDTRTRVTHTLIEADRVPAGMVPVPGGPYQLASWQRPSLEAVDLGGFYIDRYEVSNRDFKAFVDAGGYRTPDLWSSRFVRDGAELDRGEAMELLVDRTGLPGPRGWINQDYPEGEGDLPVTGVSWYEAMAYAAWRGGRLPTVFEWQKAARVPGIHPTGTIMPWGALLPSEPVDRRAHFNQSGPVDVHAYPFGISPYGAHNMAGNVKEWCFNAAEGGFATAGGSWADAPYAFGALGSFDGFYADATLGFRVTVPMERDPGSPPPSGMRLPARPSLPDFEPVGPSDFEALRAFYTYDALPDSHQVLAVETFADWTRELIRLPGGQADDLVAYFYRPRHVAPPYQLLAFAPPLPTYAGWRSVTYEVETVMAPHIKAGRAILAVVPAGGVERPRSNPRWFRAATNRAFRSTVTYSELIQRWATDFRRGTDYALARPDVDPARVAYVALSASDDRLIYPALDDRYAAAVLIAGAVRPLDLEKLPEANPINFVPHIRVPTLVVHGRYDEIDPVATHTQPLMDLLPPSATLRVVDGGHVPPASERVPVINGWLDEVLGPVQR